MNSTASVALSCLSGEQQISVASSGPTNELGAWKRFFYALITYRSQDAMQDLSLRITVYQFSFEE